MRLALAVVPPMSKEMRSGRPSWSPKGGGGDDAGGGAGLDEGGGHAQSLVDGEDATARTHEVEGRVLAFFEEVGEGVEVAFEDGGDVGADGGGAGALVFADFGEDFAGEEDADAGEAVAQGVADGAFVVGVEEGEEEADGDGFDMVGLEEGNQGVEFVEGKGGGHTALGVDALGDFEAEVAGGK